MVKAIIFDLGGVILTHKPTLIGDILSQMFPMSEEEGNSIFLQNRIILLKGELSSRQFLEQLKSKFKIDQTIDELSKLWMDLYIKNAQIDYKLLDFIQELKARYKVYLLTDTIDVHDAFNKRRGIYDKFTKVFKSFEEKLAKADGQAFYIHVLEKIDTKPEECVFIDDLEEQIRTAESLGAKGIVYKNLSQLKEELNKWDIRSGN